MANSIGSEIRRRREELDITQQQLADRLGYKSKSTINKIESGVNDITQSKISSFARALYTTPGELMKFDDMTIKEGSSCYNVKLRCLIPVLGKVQAGIPIEAVENIIDHEEISEEMAKSGEFFGLQVNGNSMEPRFIEGDVVIVKKQSDVETGEIGIVLVDGIDATIKRVVKHDNGISLIALNSIYPPKFYTLEEIVKLPVEILGKVVELRGKF